MAIKDLRLSNIHVEDSGEELRLYFIDHEYSKIEANYLMKELDYLTLFSSARQTGNFKSFFEGFKNSDADTVYLSLILSIFVFGYHAVLLGRDKERFVKGIKSIPVR